MNFLYSPRAGVCCSYSFVVPGSVIQMKTEPLESTIVRLGRPGSAIKIKTESVDSKTERFEHSISVINVK